MAQSVSNVSPSSSLFRLVGYGLLVLALFDFIHILVPLRLMDPMWEFQTVGALVERVSVPLLGLMLVFYGETSYRKKWEITLLKFLSWASLLIGLLFFLLIPLVAVNTSRINNQINYQTSNQVSQQMTQLQQLENQVSKSTAKDINEVATRLNQGQPLDIKDPQEVKSRVLSEITKAKQIIQPQTEAALADRRFALLKSSAKWLLGALVSGVLFIYVWANTRWARRGSRRSKGLSTANTNFSQ